MSAVWIVGAGLAGCEAALQLAARGISVKLFEMKPEKRTPAQVSDGFAELVCSNSFRGASFDSAVGAIKEEMRMIGGRLIRFADASQVPAGGALAVDREKFSALVTEAVQAEPAIEVVHQELRAVPTAEEAEQVVIATGPLTSPELAASIEQLIGGERLYFYDAIAPIVSADSIDTTIAYRMSRYGKGDGDDYLNCPMDEPTYRAFIDGILSAEKVGTHDFEEAKFFEGCLPIEVMASRGFDTLRYGPMKPVGLPDPRTGETPHAVVQLRAENIDRTAYNLVGFQTRMKWGPQKEIFRMIPGLGEVEFLRMGSIHRNTYVDSPELLDEQLRLRAAPHVRFAGQITGVEGYVESTACGLLVALMIASERVRSRPLTSPPKTTVLGAMYGHILGLDRTPGAKKVGHVPSNVHWGLCPQLDVRARKRERKRLYGERALQDVQTWWSAERF